VGTVSIGLDIGSSAARAAEIEVDGNRRIVRRYGQVGLEPGWVADGEIVNGPAVAEAIRRLWGEVGFHGTEVVLGVSGPRVFVRQAEVPALDAGDLRSALRFNAADLLPIPLEETSFDFSVLGSAQPAGEPEHLKVLLVAAHQETLSSYLSVLDQAGLGAVAMDAAALALLRAVPPAAGDEGLEVIVSIGAELTTVAVRDAGVPRFIRTLTVGGNRLTHALADSLHLELAAAERLKRGAVAPDHPQLAQARKALGGDIRDLAEDVRATVDFFASQAEGREVSRILMTGGASQTRGLAAAVGGDLPAEIFQVAPFAGLEAAGLGLDPDGLERAAATATTAVGLALWPVESPLIRLSILPEEVTRRRQARRMLKLAATGVAAAAGLLAVLGAGQVVRVHDARAKVSADNRQIAALQAQVSTLQRLTAVHGEAAARVQLEVSALNGDIDWVRVLEQLAASMPPGVRITSFTGTRSATPGSAASTAAGSPIGTVSVSVAGGANADAAANWLDALLVDGDLANTQISGISIPVGSTTGATFSSTSSLTPAAKSSRAQAAQQ
jgi:type IV pilus assembly protein PilM